MKDLLRLLVESDGKTITISTYNNISIGIINILDCSLSTIYDSFLSKELEYGELLCEVSENIFWDGYGVFGQGNGPIGDYSYAIGVDAVFIGNGTLVTREWVNGVDERINEIINYE